MSSRVVFPEKRFKATHDVEDLGSSSVTKIPGYILCCKDDAPPIIIKKNVKYPLRNPIILKGFHVTIDIISNLNKFYVLSP